MLCSTKPMQLKLVEDKLVNAEWYQHTLKHMLNRDLANIIK